ncbi:MAG: hypothetical protein CMJ31_08890 [Phycisphaerae bacterium]|nr:hypothetical protein [Phycisphaerae bacterium]
MLRIFPQYGAATVRQYFTEALCRDDYYEQGTEMPGVWRGHGAELLGLEGHVEREHFARMTDNLHPTKDERLTPRTKEGRRVGYDISFSVPKSVSIAYAVTGDKDILWAFSKSVWDTMAEMETSMSTRVRRDGADDDRTTGNMVWAEYQHFTTRPIDGEPDPHLHKHCFTFNCTFDREEQRWKAAQFAELKRRAPYFQAVFFSRLAANLVSVGYEVEPTEAAFELAGVPRVWVELYSRRTMHLESIASELGFEQTQKSRLGALTRERKRDDLPLGELRTRWRSRLRDEDIAFIEKLKHNKEVKQQAAEQRRLSEQRVQNAKDAPEREPGHDAGKSNNTKETRHEASPKRARSWHPLVSLSANNAVKHAIGELFQTDAIITEQKLLVRAMELSYGRADLHQLIDAIAKRPELVRRTVDDVRYLTTKEAVREEQELVRFAKRGRNSVKPLGRSPLSLSAWKLDHRDTEVLAKLMESTDRVTLFKYSGPSRKPELSRAAMTGIQQKGYSLVVMAADSAAARRAELDYSIDQVRTVASVLADDEYQSIAKNIVPKVFKPVFWVEDAGRLGTRTVAELARAADRCGGRLVLSGDGARSKRRERGDPFRLLREEARLTSVERRVMVDKEDGMERVADAVRNDAPRRAVDTLREHGKLVVGHDHNGTLNAVAEFFKSQHDKGRSVLLTTTTRYTAGMLNALVRSQLRDAGVLKGQDRSVVQLDPVWMSDTERLDAKNYKRGMVIDFYRPTRGFASGQRTKVVSSGPQGVWVLGKALNPVKLRLDHSDRFTVSTVARSHLAVGDRIRITRYTTPLVGKPIRSGTVVTVKAFNPFGHIVVDGNRILPRSMGHFEHDYAVSTHRLHDRRADSVAFVGFESGWANAESKDLTVAADAAKTEFTVFVDDDETLVNVLARVRPELNATDLETDPEAVDLQYQDHERRFESMQNDQPRGHSYG